jgi:hypothetical protein
MTVASISQQGWQLSIWGPAVAQDNLGLTGMYKRVDTANIDCIQDAASVIKQQLWPKLGCNQDTGHAVPTTGHPGTTQCHRALHMHPSQTVLVWFLCLPGALYPYLGTCSLTWCQSNISTAQQGGWVSRTCCQSCTPTWVVQRIVHG